MSLEYNIMQYNVKLEVCCCSEALFVYTHTTPLPSSQNKLFETRLNGSLTKASSMFEFDKARGLII